jgi:uncharacterized membrane protein
LHHTWGNIMEHIIKTHLWLANLFFLSSILMTSLWMIKRHKKNIFTQLPGKILYMTEMIFTGLVPAVGVWLLVTQPVWLKFPDFRIKLIAALSAIGLIHFANVKMKKYIAGENTNPSLITYSRIVALLLLLVSYNYGLSLLNYSRM